MIGAGSIGFTRRLMRDILTVPELADTTFALHRHHRSTTSTWSRSCAAATSRPTSCRAKIDADHRPPRGDRRRRLRHLHDPAGRPRGVPDRHRHPAEVRRRPVRRRHASAPAASCTPSAHIPALLDFCKDIREVAKPGALFLNYSNPMAMNTWACNEYGGVKTIGLCHGVQGAHWQIADCIEHWAQREGCIGADEKLAPQDVDYHLPPASTTRPGTSRSQWRGIDMIPTAARAVRGASRVSAQTEKVRIDVLQRFGYYCTESQRPPVRVPALVPQARRTRSRKWIDMSSWINGETGGYLRVCTEGRNWFETDFPNWLKQEPPHDHAPRRAARSTARYIIEALETGRVYRGHFNVVNHGAHHQPARRLRHRDPRLRRSQRHQHAGRRRPAAGLRRDLLGQRPRAADGHGGRGARRRRRCSSRRCCTTRWSARSATRKRSGR